MIGLPMDWLNTIGLSPLVNALLRLGLILLIALVTSRALRVAARRLESRVEKTKASPERLARLRTLAQVGHGTLQVVILALTILMILVVVGVDITPLLASVGLAGLALSLGAQTLIKDYIGGILILTEDQFAVGDIIAVKDASGEVERITLRATYLRDVEGRLHIVSNGDIRVVSNLTAEWSRAVVELNVDYQADMGRAVRALESAAARAQADEAIKNDLLEPPQALGWIGLSDWAVKVRVIAKTAPGRQWDVMMTLRRYMIEALQAEGVRVAIPAQDVRLGRAPSAERP